MLEKLVESSPDLQRLRADGYALRMVEERLVVDGLRYVGNGMQVKLGTLITDLDIAGERTAQPSWHVVYWAGDIPRGADGNVLTAMVHESTTPSNLLESEEFSLVCHLSSRPDGLDRFEDYYAKVTHYAYLLSREADSHEANDA